MTKTVLLWQTLGKITDVGTNRANLEPGEVMGKMMATLDELYEAGFYAGQVELSRLMEKS